MVVFDSIWGTWLPYFVLSGLATLIVGGVLLAARRPPSLAVLTGPAFGVGLVWLIDQSDTPTTTGDRVVLITACVIGSLFAAWPIPFARWVYTTFRDAERRLEREQINA